MQHDEDVQEAIPTSLRRRSCETTPHTTAHAKNPEIANQTQRFPTIGLKNF